MHRRQSLADIAAAPPAADLEASGDGPGWKQQHAKPGRAPAWRRELERLHAPCHPAPLAAVRIAFAISMLAQLVAWSDLFVQLKVGCSSMRLQSRALPTHAAPPGPTLAGRARGRRRPPAELCRLRSSSAQSAGRARAPAVLGHLTSPSLRHCRKTSYLVIPYDWYTWRQPVPPELGQALLGLCFLAALALALGLCTRGASVACCLLFAHVYRCCQSHRGAHAELLSQLSLLGCVVGWGRCAWGSCLLRLLLACPLPPPTPAAAAAAAGGCPWISCAGGGAGTSRRRRACRAGSCCCCACCC